MRKKTKFWLPKVQIFPLKIATVVPKVKTQEEEVEEKEISSVLQSLNQKIK